MIVPSRFKLGSGFVYEYVDRGWIYRLLEKLRIIKPEYEAISTIAWYKKMYKSFPGDYPNLFEEEG